MRDYNSVERGRRADIICRCIIVKFEHLWSTATPQCTSSRNFNQDKL